GISKRVGLPIWTDYLNILASICEEHDDDLSAQLMRKRAQDQDYSGAAAVYETCKAIPEGERYKGLVRPFTQFDKDKLILLKPLFSLPFSGIVTTNYDQVPHRVLATQLMRHALPLELDDKTL